MKRLISYAITAALLLIFTACDGENNKESEPKSSRSQETTTAAQSTEPPDKSTETNESTTAPDTTDPDEVPVNPIGEVMQFPESDNDGVITVAVTSLYQPVVAYKVDWSGGVLTINEAETNLTLDLDLSTYNLMDDILVITEHGTDIFPANSYFFNKQGEIIFEIVGEIGNSGLFVKNKALEYAVDGDIIIITVEGGCVAHGDFIGNEPTDDDDAVSAEFEIRYNMSDGTFGDFTQSKVIMTYREFKKEFGG